MVEEGMDTITIIMDISMDIRSWRSVQLWL
jgi:hypothetical protein